MILGTFIAEDFICVEEILCNFPRAAAEIGHKNEPLFVSMAVRAHATSLISVSVVFTYPVCACAFCVHM